MIYRYEYRAEVSPEFDVKDIEKYYKKSTAINTLSLFADDKVLYLFFETTLQGMKPDDFFELPTGFLKTWPGSKNADGTDRTWVYMYPMFYHAKPQDEKSWNLDRKPEHFKGRIAHVKPDEVSSYVYYHRALVDEGLLKGDKYHFISLHENILFSYFEEPKTFVNLSNSEEQSEIIKDYLAYGEETVFERKPGSDLNFEFIDMVFHI